MTPSYFPLRWESTGDEWWYASPIDLAAANGHLDLVRELLQFDTNLLIKLTSLRRIRRLETVWDDEEQFNDIAKNRSKVAKKLLECEPQNGHGYSSLIRAGYGGWLLYTAASAGDVAFVKDLLDRDPLLVFGEGEYGVTDILYAAARSKNFEVFKVLMEFCLWSKCNEIGSVFKMEMMSRAVHGGARGGSVEILKQILEDSEDVLVFRDLQGSTLLHSACGRGQIEVVKYLLDSYDIISSKDSQGNTALHIAAYNGHLQVIELLISSSPTLITMSNNHGDTFLHMAVAGFRTPGFRRVDRQIKLMKHLVTGNILDLSNIINIKNNDGRTALHVVVIENIHPNLVELLMSVRNIDLNIKDTDQMSPLDLLRQRSKSASSDILIKRLVSAGGISKHDDYMTRTTLVSHLKTHGIVGSPGTSFRVPDSEIIFYANPDKESMYSGELTWFNSPARSNSEYRNRGSGSSAARRLKLLFGWGRRKEGNDDCDSIDSFHLKTGKLENSLMSYRGRYSKCSISMNKRVLGVSPVTKMRSTGLTHGALGIQSPSSQYSISSWSSCSDDDDDNIRPSNVGTERYMRSSTNPWINLEKPKFHRRQSSLSKILMNQVSCFGAQGLAVDEPVRCPNPRQSRIGSVG